MSCQTSETFRDNSGASIVPAGEKRGKWWC